MNAFYVANRRSTAALVALLLATAGASVTGGVEPKEDATPGKSAPFLNVLDFGAKAFEGDVGDAAKVAQYPDATDAIQAALDAGTGRTVFLPKGVYRITRPLTMKAGTTFMGEGLGGAVLTTEKPLTAVIHLKRVSGPMTVIRDLFFAAPLGGNWQCDGILLEETNGITVRDCWFGAWRRAVHLQGVSDHWLRNIIYELNAEGVVVSGGPELARSHGNLRMLDCYGYQNREGDIRMENVRGAQIQACSSVGSNHWLSLKNCANVSINGANVNWDGSPHVRFGMRLEDSSLVTIVGCSIDGQRDVGLMAVNSKLLTIGNNVISNTSEGPAVRFDRCSQTTLCGNTLSQSLTHGLHLTQCTEVVASQNVVEGYSTGKAEHDPNACFGLLCDGVSQRCTFTDNIITPTPQAGKAIHLSDEVKDVTVRP